MGSLQQGGSDPWKRIDSSPRNHKTVDKSNRRRLLNRAGRVVVQHHTTTSVGNVADAVAAEGRLGLVGAGAHLEHAVHQLLVTFSPRANTAARAEDVVERELLGDVDLVAERLDGGCVVLAGLVPQQALDRDVQTLRLTPQHHTHLQHHDLLVPVQRLAERVVLLQLRLLLLRVVRALQERRVVALRLTSKTEAHLEEGVQTLQVVLDHLARSARRLLRDLTDLHSQPPRVRTRRLIASMSLLGEAMLSREWLER